MGSVVPIFTTVYPFNLVNDVYIVAAENVCIYVTSRKCSSCLANAFISYANARTHFDQVVDPNKMPYSLASDVCIS